MFLIIFLRIEKAVLTILLNFMNSSSCTIGDVFFENFNGTTSSFTGHIKGIVTAKNTSTNTIDVPKN